MPGFPSLSARGVLRRILLAAALCGLLIPVARATPILLVEADTGKVLEQQDAGKPWYPASITKLMTAMVILDSGVSLEQRVAISGEDYDYLKGSHSRLRPGTSWGRWTS